MRNSELFSVATTVDAVGRKFAIHTYGGEQRTTWDWKGTGAD